jgi:hypothetical protein
VVLLASKILQEKSAEAGMGPISSAEARKLIEDATVCSGMIRRSLMASCINSPVFCIQGNRGKMIEELGLTGREKEFLARRPQGRNEFEHVAETLGGAAEKLEGAGSGDAADAVRVLACACRELSSRELWFNTPMFMLGEHENELAGLKWDLVASIAGIAAKSGSPEAWAAAAEFLDGEQRKWSDTPRHLRGIAENADYATAKKGALILLGVEKSVPAEAAAALLERAEKAGDAEFAARLKSSQLPGMR